MARKRYSTEKIIGMLREAEVKLAIAWCSASGQRRDPRN